MHDYLSGLMSHTEFANISSTHVSDVQLPTSLVFLAELYRMNRLIFGHLDQSVYQSLYIAMETKHWVPIFSDDITMIKPFLQNSGSYVSLAENEETARDTLIGILFNRDASTVEETYFMIQFKIPRTMILEFVRNRKWDRHPYKDAWRILHPEGILVKDYHYVVNSVTW